MPAPALVLFGWFLAAAVWWGWTGFTPPVRMRWEFALKGAALGGLLALVSAAGRIALGVLDRQLAITSLDPILSISGVGQPASQELDDRTRWGVCRAFGEEVLVRGFLFVSIATQSLPLGYAVNFLVSFVLGARASAVSHSVPFRSKLRQLVSRDSMKRGVVAALEGTVLAYFVLTTRSLFGAALARLILELARPLIADFALQRLPLRFGGENPGAKSTSRV